jgi:hypothetical protein
MAKPVIPQGFVLDESPQESQQGNYQENFGLPAGFQLDDENQSSESKMSMGEAVFTTATNPLGFGDEIKAGISAGVAKLFGGQATQNIDIGDLYREARTSERAKLDKARQDQPLTSFAGQIFSDVGVAGKSLKALGLTGQSFGTAVKGGASLGGASALGETEDLTNIPQTLKDVATGVVAGGVVGGAVQQAAPYVISGAQNVALKAKKATSYIKNLFIKDTAEEVGAKAIDPESAKLALKELLDKPSDKPLTGVDIQNPEFKTFARSVVSKYPQAREIVKDFTEGRNKEAFTRINNDLKIISKIDNADDYTKQISDTQKSLASPLYAEAEADRTIVPKFEFKEVKTTTSPQTTTVSEGVKSFKTDSSTKTKTDFINKYNLQSKSRDIEKPKSGVAGIKAGSSYDKRDLSKKGIEEFQNTLRKQTTTIEEGGKIVNVRKEIANLNQMSPKSIELAKQLDELENNKIYSKFKTQAKERLDEDISDNSVAMLHKIRKRIDADIARQYDTFGKPIDKDAIADNTKLRNKIDNIIGEVSPTFKEADNVFRPLAIKKDAVEFGKEFSKYEPSEIIKKINEFTSKSGLKRQDILDDVKVGAKNTIVKDVEKLIKFDSSNIPTEIQVKKIIENKFKKDQLKTFLGEKDYGEFIDNINKEALFNKAIKSLRLDRPSTQEESTNFILRAFNGLISYATSNFGKYAAITNATKAGEQFLVKNYRGLNPENAKEIAKIITNKNASIKYLENIINKASKEQKPFVSQAITDLKQLDKFSGKAAVNTLDFGIDDPNAEEPVLMQNINTEQEVQKIKQQFYKE